MVLGEEELVLVLYMGVVVERFFYCVDIFFRWRRSMLFNFLNYDCLCSSSSWGKDTLHHPVPEGEHTAAAS